MAVVRHATVTWTGNLIDGGGTVTAFSSGAFSDLPVSWSARTENSEGLTSPEELLAAAHASCFSMAFSSDLTKAGFPPDHVHVSCEVTFDKVDGRWTVMSSSLEVAARVPGIDEDTFQRVAAGARDGCPISRALVGNVDLQVDAVLETEDH
jgi:osmotically inducible protein OsmC